MVLSVYEIGKKIAVARKLRNLSQAQLAEALSISAQAVGKWERGESMPDIITFQRLAETVGVDLNYFSGNREVPSLVLDKSAFTNPVVENEHKQGWNMSSGNWIEADFSGLRGLAKKLSSANIKRCNFAGSEMSKVSFKANNIIDCDFSNSELNLCKFSSSNIRDNNFTGCNLAGSTFSSSNVQNCNFNEANLSEVQFKWSHFKNNQLSRAVLNNLVFRLGQFTEVIFSSEITSCSFENNDFSKVEFNGAIIRNSFFKNCKLKRAKFVDCQADKLSYSFMKVCQADLAGVTIVE
ncbi:MAG: pentapeptide repeat-containing protein [Dehalococcoidia bacterium]|nr:pentapeptide repeat-containing protein [Dehalococcoidia bacterium]